MAAHADGEDGGGAEKWFTELNAALLFLRLYAMGSDELRATTALVTLATRVS